jgi:small subunit ribosomal protein S6
VQEKLQRLTSLVAPNGGDSLKVDLWGKRKLAYPIDKKEQGIYAVLRYETEPSSLTEFERVMRLDEQVLRQLTVVDPIVATPPPVRAPRPAEEEE